MAQKRELSGKVCIVTGAGKGIGREISRLFYDKGATIALFSRDRKDLDDLQRELKASRARILCCQGDASDEAVVIAFVQAIVRRWGRIDVLVNNAGMRFRRSFLDITTDEWKTVMNNNLNSVYYFCREAGRMMVRQKHGKIINMASVIGTLGLPDLSAYGASKGGIITLTKCLAVEWAKYHVNVNAIAPGFCATTYAEKFKKNQELYQFTLDRTPQGTWGTSRDIANACLFLSTDAAQFITGEVLSVDGGWSAW